MEKRNILRNQKGFTLIEIIAVLVILGILAVVAVPRFVGLQDQARASSANQIIAAGVSQIHMDYSRLLLSTGSAAAAWTEVTTGTNAQDICDEVNMDGFDSPVITCTATAVDGDVTVDATVDGQAGDTVTVTDPT